jgi:DNA-binding NarL/FixJ family response regulator
VIRALVADDQQAVRAGFAALLETQPDITVVATAANREEAVQQNQEHRPDIVLMDIRMPVLDGIAATRQMCAPSGDARPRVLVLTTFDLDEYVYDALQAGASGFLLKDAPPETLFEAVRVVAAGDALLAPAVTRRLIAAGLSNNEIAHRLVLSNDTVKTHVSHILRKLGLRDRAQAVVAAYESGLVVPGS